MFHHAPLTPVCLVTVTGADSTGAWGRGEKAKGVFLWQPAMAAWDGAVRMEEERARKVSVTCLGQWQAGPSHCLP